MDNNVKNILKLLENNWELAIWILEILKNNKNKKIENSIVRIIRTAIHKNLIKEEIKKKEKIKLINNEENDENIEELLKNI